jgi:hypothetical protein
MTHSREDVLRSVRAACPDNGDARVVDLLDRYGVASYERERERVQLAILKLAEGNEEKLRELVDIAKHDYRDVLLWAEYPEEAQLDTPQKRQEAGQLLRKLGIEPPPELAK